jgi:hypothetical protein
MNTSNYNDIISDNNIIDKYENKLYKYMYNDKCDLKYNKIYYTSSDNYENNIHSLENTNQNKKEKTLFIKLEGYGDYQISIYKVNKPNNFISKLMNKIFKKQLELESELELKKNKIYFNNVNEYKKIKNQNKLYVLQNFEKMCTLLKLDIQIYTDINCDKKNKTCLNKSIDIYELMFEIIFNYKYSDMINYKIIKDDGNFILVIFEFKKSYYIIDYSTS